MKLIYRAQTFSHQPVPVQPYRQQRALNWRFQAPGQSYGEPLPIAAYHPPRALNWRFQMASGIVL